MLKIIRLKLVIYIKILERFDIFVLILLTKSIGLACLQRNVYMASSYLFNDYLKF